MTNQTQQVDAGRVLEAAARSAVANVLPSTAAAGFLPAPKPPPRPHHLPDSDTVAVVAGAELAEPLARIEAAYDAAEAAVRNLVEARPGGEVFRLALEADVADELAGERPKRWRVEVLVEGDRRRWADAVVACRTASALPSAGESGMDKSKIATAARKAADKAAALWGAAASAGWAGRADKAAAWQSWRAGEVALVDYWTASRLWEWAAGAPGREPVANRIVRIPDVEALPAAPMARGSWLALSLVLEPMVWLDIPQGVVWPDEEAEHLALAAIPEDAGRLLGLKGAAGVHGTSR